MHQSFEQLLEEHMVARKKGGNLVRTGSLGVCTQRTVFETWVCMDHFCAARGDLYCYAFNQRTRKFIPW